MPRTHRPIALLAACGLAASSVVGQDDPLAEPFVDLIELANIRPPAGDGLLGAALAGPGGLNRSGYAVAIAGDVNGDGFDDVIIGADQRVASPPLGRGRGTAHVVFGGPEPWPTIDLSEVGPWEGFALVVQDDEAQLGLSVAGVGDVNGDGLDDVAVGAIGPSHFGGGADGGAIYVVFGRDVTADPFPVRLDVATLDGVDGFVLRGTCCVGIGASVAGIGDVNGDGIDDLAAGGNYPLTVPSDQFGGLAYVVYGRDSRAGHGFPPVLSTNELRGGNGWRFRGTGRSKRVGSIVASAGDINGDGFDDVVIGAPGERLQEYCYSSYFCYDFGSGRAYVVFGRDAASDPFPEVVRPWHLEGVGGFTIYSGTFDARMGTGVAGVGDINGDGINDLAVGSPGTNLEPYGFPINNQGEVHVIYGREGPGAFESVVDPDAGIGLLGFKIEGSGSSGGLGMRVAGLGDVNGDGRDDLAAAAAGPDRAIRGEVAVIFGRDGGPAAFPPVLRATDVSGDSGLWIRGAESLSDAGTGLGGGGDVNGDGIDDVLVGAPLTDGLGRDQSGEAYVVFGRGRCRVDQDGDGSLTIFDFLTFLRRFEDGDRRADFDFDGDFTTFDFLAFQNAFHAGCP